MQDLTREQELALIRDMVGGDNNGFERLIGRYLPEIERVVSSRLRRADGHNPDEAVQDVLITAWKALPRYIEAYPFSSYVFGITREVIRRRLADRRRDIPTDWESEESPLSGEPDPRTYQATTGRLRNLIGVDRFPCPDGERLRSAVLSELLEAFFGYGGYPHQQIAFAYSIILWGKPKTSRSTRPASNPGERPSREKVPICGDPDRVVRELSSAPLAESSDELHGELVSKKSLSPEAAQRVFLPLDYRLCLKGKELFARDGRSAALFGHLAGTVVGSSLLEQYFGKDARKSVADWTERVKMRTREALMGGPDAARSPLPWPPGHENSHGGA